MWTLPAALSLQRLTGARRSSAPSLRSRGYRSLLQLHVVFTVTLPPRWGKGHSGTSLDIPPSGYSLSLMDVFRQYLGLYLIPFVVTEDPFLFTLSSVDMLFFFVLPAPTSCASRHLMSSSLFVSGLTLSAMGPSRLLLDAFPCVMLLRCRSRAHALLLVPMLSPCPTDGLNTFSGTCCLLSLIRITG